MRNFIIIFVLFFSVSMFSQDLNCTVVVNAQKTGDENLQIFKTLEKQLNEFVRDTKWTNKSFSPQERIDCSMNIIITNYNADQFQGYIQVQSSRPVYGSTYSTPIYNFNDNDFSFRYLEFQNMIYNPTQFESNLISVLAFHIHIILGLDADSFTGKGGEDYFKQALTILNYSQQENFKGWKLEDGLQSRFVLIDNLLSPTFKEYRNVMYSYHREGMDMMHADPKSAKELIANSLKELEVMNNRRPNSFLLRTFFDAKADEIEQIYTDGPNVNISSLVSTLQKIAPSQANRWRNIKF